MDKRKNKFLKIAAYLMLAILASSSVYIPKASATESYFTAEGSTLELDKIDPSEPDQRLVDVRLKATREMTIHSMHGYFTPISNEDEELDHYMSWMDYLSGISHLCYSMSTGEFDWNTPDCIDDVASDEGTETGKEIRGVTMDAYVRAGHDLSVYKYITGNGSLDVPNTVVGGTDVEVGIVPEPGNELVYLELDGQEVTDQIQDNVFRVTPDTRVFNLLRNLPPSLSSTRR